MFIVLGWVCLWVAQVKCAFAIILGFQHLPVTFFTWHLWRFHHHSDGVFRSTIQRLCHRQAVVRLQQRRRTEGWRSGRLGIEQADGGGDGRADVSSEAFEKVNSSRRRRHPCSAGSRVWSTDSHSVDCWRLAGSHQRDYDGWLEACRRRMDPVAGAAGGGGYVTGPLVLFWLAHHSLAASAAPSWFRLVRAYHLIFGGVCLPNSTCFVAVGSPARPPFARHGGGTWLDLALMVKQADWSGMPERLTVIGD